MIIKVILIDDHSIVRDALKQTISAEKDIRILGEANSGQEGIKLVQNTRPHVVILDFMLPDMSGLDVTKKLLHWDPDLKILILTSAVNDLIPFRLLEAGAHGYITKEATAEELIRTIHSLHAGQRVISPEIASRLALTKVDYNAGAFTVLSEREYEVMMLVIGGHQVKEIAKILQVDPKTIHSYRSRIFEKLNVKNDMSLTLLAMRHGILAGEEKT
jgi:two-component system invasion response regulator UvrY